MSESVPKHRKLGSASQLQHYSKERVTRNFIPNAITVRGILPVEEREAHSGQWAAVPSV